jgi:hypothetical protein
MPIVRRASAARIPLCEGGADLGLNIRDDLVLLLRPRSMGHRVMLGDRPRCFLRFEW